VSAAVHLARGRVRLQTNDAAGAVEAFTLALTAATSAVADKEEELPAVAAAGGEALVRLGRVRPAVEAAAVALKAGGAGLRATYSAARVYARAAAGRAAFWKQTVQPDPAWAGLRRSSNLLRLASTYGQFADAGSN
jgi:hypothetical protein